MKTILGSTRWTYGLIAAAAVLAGCGQLPATSSAPQPVEQSSRPNEMHSDGWGSWMSPEAKHEDLVYVTNTLSNNVSVYAWMGHKLVGVLAGINAPYGLCSDKNGDVWVVGWGWNQLREYAHAGTKPLKVLRVDDPNADLYDCSVDPLTGNLAVTNWGYNWYQGYTLIYPHASGTPKSYNGERIWFFYGCSYDDKGNLFVDGWDAYVFDVFSLAELPRGATSFHRILLLPSIDPTILGGVQWDGKYVAIGNMGSVVEYSVRGRFATLKGYTPLTPHWPLGDFWIRTFANGEREIVAPDRAGGPYAFQYWKYPAGGNALGTVTASLSGPFGTTVSLAKR